MIPLPVLSELNNVPCTVPVYETLLIATGLLTTVALPTTLPDAFATVMTKDHDEPINEANVAVPADELDGVAVLPLMVYVVIMVVPVPPNHVTVNPLGVMSEGIMLVTGVGNASTMTFPTTTLLVVFDVVITNAQGVPNPVNNVNVAVPIDELEGVAEVPLMVYVVVVNSPIPPDQVTVNSLVVIAEVAIFVMGDNV